MKYGFQLLTFEIALGLFAHAVAQAGKPVVAVTVDFVKVAQKAEAVAAWAVMNEAHYDHA